MDHPPDVINILPIDATLPILLFIFVCLVFPQMVRHRPQYYAALGLILLRLFLSSIAEVFNNAGLRQVSAGMGGLIEIAVIALLVMCVGGLSTKELIGGFTEAIDAIRHPDHDKPIIVQRTGDRPRPKDDDADDKPKVYTINTPKDEGSVPME